ncbi:hypothetical protein [Corynebacterium camporealensis]|nr:hypothetical protein [Corynebacterium camporealensis]
MTCRPACDASYPATMPESPVPTMMTGAVLSGFMPHNDTSRMCFAVEN